MPDLMLPSVDIITPIYNRAHFLEPLYYSIVEHKIIHNWIVIDDDSVDCPENILESLPQSSSLKIVYKKIKKSGFNAALNVGFSLLSSDFFFKVDSDDLLSDNFSICFERVFRLLTQQNQIASIYGFSFRTSDAEGNLIGSLNIPDIYKISLLPPTYLCKYSFMRVYGKRSSGDFLDLFESSFAKYQFRYPLFGDEFKSPTSMLHTSYALHYSHQYVAYVDVPFLIKNYLPDGLTQLKVSDLTKNPKSYLVLALQHSSFPNLTIPVKVSILKTCVRALYCIAIRFVLGFLR